jgi:hypothetical protein
MTPCDCLLCRTRSTGRRDELRVLIDCPMCGRFDLTTHAEVEWNGLKAGQQGAALPLLRDMIRAAPVGVVTALTGENVRDAAGVLRKGRLPHSSEVP